MDRAKFKQQEWEEKIEPMIHRHGAAVVRELAKAGLLKELEE